VIFIVWIGRYLKKLCLGINTKYSAAGTLLINSALGMRNITLPIYVALL
jgi:hypothetical protein